MSDMNDLSAQYARHQALRTQANAVNKETVFDALAAAGIATVTVNFNGEGDNGQIDGIATQGEVTCLPDSLVELEDVPWGAQAPVRTRIPLREAVEQLCYDLLAQEHDGWENNDGAYGDFTFDVAHRRIALDFNARFSDSVNSTHSF